ncbi:hypothetical protein RHGRI_031943 [Rhododendron griersonianum]|uniref:Uncharacterized protein n=1 Tax=Rhododendron griersonianum TaxID=479676 RepID=A0AAV6IDC0_9ERIC|nr:hypothetical protein RHGRI_031943 [Rhododendron griersonianum]
MMGCLKKGNVAPVEEIKGLNVAGGSNPDGVGGLASQEIAARTSSVDSFYEKLSKQFESSGLSLLFNFRETSLDLYVFYKEVTDRGGFCLVTKDGKWVEVASTLNSKSIVSMSPIQLQKLYAQFLYQFEQTYHYRTPAQAAAAPGHSSGMGDNSNSSSRKRNHGSISPFLTVDLFNEDRPTAKKKCGDNSNQMSTGPPKKKLVHKPPKKDRKKDPNAPLRSRSAYQLFLMKECDRLKKIHGETSASQNTRNMVIDAWRHLSESGRQPYVEESMKDKERFNREMNAYKERKNMPGKTDGDYHVNVQLAPGNFFIPDESAAELASRLMKNGQPNESAAELASRLMKNGANGQPTEDALFQINWDSYCGSLDIPI